MTRTALAVAAVAALGSVSAQAAPPYKSPVVLVAEPGSCPSGTHDIGYVGPEGARWRICQGPINRG